MSEKIKPRILCAAIWYKDMPTVTQALPDNLESGLVCTGYRHNTIIATVAALSGLRTISRTCGAFKQGFITSDNRFVDRREAAVIAFDAGQIETHQEVLYSEALY